jgi:2-methylisocitrate lyase-like PEP mutase family enzyme
MVERVKAAVAAPTDPDMLIVARPNSIRLGGLDEALRRGEAFSNACADRPFVNARDAQGNRMSAERLPAPLMQFAPADGFAEFPLKERDFAALGYRIAASSGSAFAAMIKAVKQSYECLAQGKVDPFMGKGGVNAFMKVAQAATGLDKLVEIERRTMKD